MKFICVILFILKYGTATKNHRTHVGEIKNNGASKGETKKSHTTKPAYHREKIGVKRDGIVNSFYDEAKEFGRENPGGRNPFPNAMMFPLSPYRDPIAATLRRDREQYGYNSPGYSEINEDVNNRNMGKDELPSNMNMQLPSSPPGYPLQHFSYPNLMPLAQPELFHRKRPDFNVRPRYTRQRGIMPAQARTLVDNSIESAQHHIDNEIDRLMYRLARAQVPERASINIPRDNLATSNNVLSNPFNLPYDTKMPRRMPDNTVVPNLDSVFSPQGVMQLGPRPLDPRYFQQPQSNMMDSFDNQNSIQPNFLMPGNEETTPYQNSVISPSEDERRYPSIVNPMNRARINPPEYNEGEYRPLIRKPRRRRRHRRRFENHYYSMQPDENAMNHIFEKIDSDERAFKNRYNNQFLGTRKNVVQRNFERDSPQSDYEAISYDDVANTDDPEQNELEDKYRMVLASMAQGSAFPRRIVDIDNTNRDDVSSEPNIGRIERFTSDGDINPIENYEMTSDRSEGILGVKRK